MFICKNSNCGSFNMDLENCCERFQDRGSLLHLCMHYKSQEEFKPKELNIYERAVEMFGVESQIDHTIQEASELILAASKYKLALESRGEDKMAICESELLLELADNRIMARQMLLIIGFNKSDLRNAIKCKHKKLEGYLESGVKF